MKNLFLLAIILLVTFGCNRSKKNASRDFVLENNSQKLEKTGEVLYDKFCVDCHASKEARDNFLAGNIRNNGYELSFLMDYINHQDSLLQHKNELAIKIKEEWSNNAYIHNFKLTEKEIKAIVYYLKK